jgi:hypothetical protein
MTTGDDIFGPHHGFKYEDLGFATLVYPKKFRTADCPVSFGTTTVDEK